MEFGANWCTLKKDGSLVVQTKLKRAKRWILFSHWLDPRKKDVNTNVTRDPDLFLGNSPIWEIVAALG
jgi:hypothetical protein